MRVGSVRVDPNVVGRLIGISIVFVAEAVDGTIVSLPIDVVDIAGDEVVVVCTVLEFVVNANDVVTGVVEAFVKTNTDVIFTTVDV